MLTRFRLDSTRQAVLSNMVYVVSFKCSRAEISYLPLCNAQMVIKKGDYVVIEAEIGNVDLGMVENVNVENCEAGTSLREFAEEQYKTLLELGMKEVGDVVSAKLLAGAPATLTILPGQTLRRVHPKRILRLATPYEINTSQLKQQNEAKAKQTCQSIVAELRLEMVILEAEWQW